MHHLLRPALAGRPILVALAVAGGIATSPPLMAEGIHQRHAVMGASVMRWLHPAPQKVSAPALRERKMRASLLDQRHGGGSYICSASGSGSRAYCFAR